MEIKKFISEQQAIVEVGNREIHLENAALLTPIGPLLSEALKSLKHFGFLNPKAHPWTSVGIKESIREMTFRHCEEAAKEKYGESWLLHFVRSENPITRGRAEISKDFYADILANGKLMERMKADVSAEILANTKLLGMFK